MALLLSRMSNMFDPTMMMDATDPMFATEISEFLQGCAGFAGGATVAVLLRLFARWHKSTKISYDDVAITLSLLPLWALVGIGIEIALHGGLAKDVHSLTVQEEAVYYPSIFVSSILYALSITAAKLSILLLYRRIFTGLKFRRVLNVFMVLCTVWCVVVILLAIFRCTPIQTSWSTHRVIHKLQYHCVPLTNLYYGTSISNLVLDVVINLLPARQIWTLQLPLRQRILLITCLALGMISIAAGVGRILTIPSLNFPELPGAIAPPETIAMPYLFLIVENAFAIICACLPTYRPLAMWLTRRVSNSSVGSKVKTLINSQRGGETNTKEHAMSSASALSAKWSRRDRNSRSTSTWFGQLSTHQGTEPQIPLNSSILSDRVGLIGTSSTKVVPGPNLNVEGDGIMVSQSWSTSTASVMKGFEDDHDEKKGMSWISSYETSPKDKGFH